MVHIINYKTTKETIAEGIAITNPVRVKDIIHAVKETNGEIITVKEQRDSSVHYMILA